MVIRTVMYRASEPRTGATQIDSPTGFARGAVPLLGLRLAVLATGSSEACGGRMRLEARLGRELTGADANRLILARSRAPAPRSLRRCVPYLPVPLRCSVSEGQYQAQPSSFIASPACQIFVMWRIFSPSKSITYT